MRPTLSACILGLSLCFCVLVHAAEDLPPPGNIHFMDGTSQEGVYVIREGLDEVIWSRDDRGQARTSRPAADIDRVEYTPIPRSERHYLRGTGAARARNWSTAVESFAQSAESSRYAYYRIDSRLQRAEALMRLRRYDEALADLEIVLNRYSNWRYVVDAMEQKAQVQLAAERTDAARQTFQQMRASAGRFGPRFGAIATARAGLGEAALLRSANQHAQAVTLLRESLNAVPLNRQPNQHAAVALALADAYQATGQQAEAKNLYLSLRFAAVDPGYRNQAFLELGKILLEEGNREQALDALITAAVLRGGNDGARAEARRRARALLTTLSNDAGVDPVLQREYRSYAASLN